MLQEDCGSDFFFCSKTQWGLKCAPFTRKVASVNSENEPALDRTAFEKLTTGTFYGYSPKTPATKGPVQMVGQLLS